MLESGIRYIICDTEEFRLCIFSRVCIIYSSHFKTNLFSVLTWVVELSNENKLGRVGILKTEFIDSNSETGSIGSGFRLNIVASLHVLWLISVVFINVSLSGTNKGVIFGQITHGRGYL